MMSFDEIIMEIEKEYKDSYEEIIESGVFRDPLNYYLVCVYPIKPFKSAESKPEEMFLNFKDEVALYFHIPFCQRRCSFCNFIISVSSKKDFVDQYLTALNKEAILVKNALQKVRSSPKIHSVYIGGGTPTYLEEAQIKFLLNKIIKENFKEYFPSDGFVELTMEASPGTLTEQKVKLLKDLGVNRISIGIQTFDDETLKLMNRDHDSNLAYQSIAYISNNFNDRFNIDLISGLPIPKDGDRRYFFERLFKDLKIVIEKNIPSVTFYHLWTRGMENTLMMKKVLTGEWILPTRGEIVKLWIMINKILIEAGYKQEPTGWFVKSENSLFKQQLFKWSEKYEYLGLGVSAYGYFNNYIYWNISKITDYINILNSDKLPIDKIRKISQDVDDRKRAVFSIKTTKGLNLSELNNKNLFLKEIEILKFLGLVQQKDNSIKLTEKGYVFFDEVSEFFFDEEDRKSIKKKLDIYTISRNRLNFLIRKCIVEKSEDLKGSSYDFKEKWEKFLTIHLFPRIKDTLEFFLKQTLGEKYVRFLLAYIYIDDNDKVCFLKPYYSSHNEWYQNVILPWFQTKINENKAISLTQTFFEPPYKIVEPYFPPPFSLSLEFPVNSAADIKMIDIRKIRSELVDLLKSSSINSISQVFNKMYNDRKFNDKVLECLFNKSKRSTTTLKNIFSQIETIILSRYPSKKGTKIFDDLEKNPWKLLPSLLAFLGNDDENVKHYIFIPLDLNEKCLPLVVVLELKDMIDDEEYKLVFDFFVSTFPIMTSFEERIRMEIKHDESLSHALRSAVAAIMARNMSHYGSHIEPGLQHRMSTFEEEILKKVG
jgi:oxygen-independent coproporphyrinogen-3 oxidase